MPVQRTQSLRVHLNRENSFKNSIGRFKHDSATNIAQYRPNLVAEAELAEQALRASELFQISSAEERMVIQKLQTFPTVIHYFTRGGKYAPCLGWNWIGQIQRIRKQEPYRLKEIYSNILNAAGIIERIQYDFKHGISQETSSMEYLSNEFVFCSIGERGKRSLSSNNPTLVRNPVDEDMAIYLEEIFKHELVVEANYQKKYQTLMMTKSVSSKRRDDVVTWIRKTGMKLLYPADTSHLAVSFLDAFLSVKEPGLNEWTLLGLTCLHIAGKLDEPHAAPISRLIRASNQFYRKQDVYSMEANVLETLKFDVYPPLAPFFAQLVLLGGSAKLPSAGAVKMILDLCNGILHNSLLLQRVFLVPASVKAQTALEIAVEFYYFYFNLFKQRNPGHYDVENCNPGQAVGDFALNLCTEMFQARFAPKTKNVPAIPRKPINPFTLSPIRQIKA